MNSSADRRKALPHAGGHHDHFEALRFDADLLEQLLDVGHPPGGLGIAALEVAVPFQAAGDIDAVRPASDGLHQMDGVHLAAAGHADDLDVGRVGEPHAAGHVRRRVGTVVAAEGHDDGFEVLHQFNLSRSPFNWAVITSSSKRMSSMAFAGHSAAQVPQPWQRAASISEYAVGVDERDVIGAGPDAEQAGGAALAVHPRRDGPEVDRVLASRAWTRAAAARAWVMLSRTPLGAWAVPATMKPGTAELHRPQLDMVFEEEPVRGAGQVEDGRRSSVPSSSATKPVLSARQSARPHPPAQDPVREGHRRACPRRPTSGLSFSSYWTKRTPRSRASIGSLPGNRRCACRGRARRCCIGVEPADPQDVLDRAWQQILEQLGLSGPREPTHWIITTVSHALTRLGLVFDDPVQVELRHDVLVLAQPVFLRPVGRAPVARIVAPCLIWR